MREEKFPEPRGPLTGKGFAAIERKAGTWSLDEATPGNEPTFGIREL